MNIIDRRIAATALDRGCLLAAISDGTQLDLIFRSRSEFPSAPKIDGYKIEDVRSIGGGLRITGTWQSGKPLQVVSINGVEIQTITTERKLFSGLNAAIAIRNGESGDIAAEWLGYHARFHGLQGVVILDLAGPDPDMKFIRRMKAALRKTPVDGLIQVVVLSSDVSLGKPGTGPEAHPFLAPDAPGKARMTPPDPDPWRAPFGEVVIFEIIRRWFLDHARAVVNLELHDLIRSPQGMNIFDLAAQSSSGLVKLAGERIYPWGIRKNKTPTFGDHICRRFDGERGNPRWCIAPAVAGADVVWRHVRVGGAQSPSALMIYDRCMALRHPDAKVSEIVPKSSLVEDEALISRAVELFSSKPLRAPEIAARASTRAGRIAVVTTMKNEGPFILEWLSYHRAIGVTDFLVYTNDCTDGTDDLLKLLQRHGVVQHRENPFRESGLKPQHAALRAAEREKLITGSDWIACIDVDEFINIHAGEGRLQDLFSAVGDANLISMTWRLFGNSDLHDFDDRFIIEQFTRCAPHLIRKPHQAWGFKTLFRNNKLFRKLGVHRPKGLQPQLVDKIRWVNGSGKPLPQSMYRNAWRSTATSYGYDLVTLNHYAVRSAESFLVKRDRGRVNHVDRDQGMNYWFRMNNNAESDTAIQRMIDLTRRELKKLLALDGVAAAHAHSVDCHRAKISELKARPDYGRFFTELTSERSEALSRLHHIFGRETFQSGPGVIPDDVVGSEHPAGYIFRPKPQKAVPG